MDLLSGPMDGLIGVEVGNERIVMAPVNGPRGESDLDGRVTASPRDPGRLEINGGEGGVADEHFGWGFWSGRQVEMMDVCSDGAPGSRALPGRIR